MCSPRVHQSRNASGSARDISKSGLEAIVHREPCVREGEPLPSQALQSLLPRPSLSKPDPRGDIHWDATGNKPLCEMECSIRLNPKGAQLAKGARGGQPKRNVSGNMLTADPSGPSQVHHRSHQPPQSKPNTPSIAIVSINTQEPAPSTLPMPMSKPGAIHISAGPTRITPAISQVLGPATRPMPTTTIPGEKVSGTAHTPKLSILRKPVQKQPQSLIANQTRSEERPKSVFIPTTTTTGSVMSHIPMGLDGVMEPEVGTFGVQTHRTKANSKPFLQSTRLSSLPK